MAQGASIKTEPVVVDCQGLSTREINLAIKKLVADGVREIVVDNPAGRHALAVAVKAEVRIHFRGSVGWYAAGMNDGPHVVVDGNCGWGLAECMMRGRVEVHGHAGSGAGASIRGGLVFVAGDAGARAGISMKGGTVVVAGDVGYMSGFMMQRGTLIVCGEAAEGLGDSMYEGTIFVGGKIQALGADAEEKEVTEQDRDQLARVLAEFGIDHRQIVFRKIESGRRLWNFSTKEPELWRAAL